MLAAAGVRKKAGRLPQEVELFSKRYYQYKVKPHVDSTIRQLEDKLERKLTRKERLNTIKSCTSSLYEASSEEVKDEIRRDLVRAKQDAAAGRSGRVLDIDARDRTPRQYQE